MSTQGDKACPTCGSTTDFRDYYDHHFLGRWQNSLLVFERLTSGGMPRTQMLPFLESQGLRVPRYGICKKLVPRLKSDFFPKSNLAANFGDIACVVVYTDESAHCGEGKIIQTWNQAERNYPNSFATEFITVLQNNMGYSLRYLRVGVRQFWLSYSSANDWRSNCGDVTIELLCEEKKCRKELPAGKWTAPLFAIDFLPVGSLLYAVDYNIAPGLMGSGLERIMSAHDVYDEISQTLLSRQPGHNKW